MSYNISLINVFDNEGFLHQIPQIKGSVSFNISKKEIEKILSNVK
jgi:hypothetical protein